MTDKEAVVSFAMNIIEQNVGVHPSVILRIVSKNHCGNGYFSWDGILDALADMIGQERATEVLRNC